MRHLALFCQFTILIWGTESALLRPFAESSSGNSPQASAGLFHRQYKLGESMKYHMKGKNEAWEYEIDGSGVVAKDDSGLWVERIGWSNLKSNGQTLPLPTESANFRQELSLDPNYMMKLPDFSKVTPMLVGPMADFMTFYTDLWLATKNGTFSKPGDHLYIKMGGANSWADGTRVILGQDSIDFDLTVQEVNENEKTVKLLVRHVPPAQPNVNLPAEWMKAKVADTPNNWVEVEKNGDGYIAEVGKETFDVTLTVDLRDGKLLRATLDNPVTAIRRVCKEAALTQCSEATPRHILRQVEVQLQP
jgi:hypothetical protein